jgi:hypothetical protein
MIMKLTQEEYNVLIKIKGISDRLKENLNKLKKNQKYKVQLNENDIDELREICIEELPLSGFDKDYKLNKKGEILESLIDKFFIN